MALLAFTLGHSLVGTIVPLMAALFSNGVLMPVSSAAAMGTNQRAAAGASGVMGAVQFAVGGAVGALVAIAAHPSVIELAITLLACLVCAAALTVGLFAAERRERKPRVAARA